MKIKKENFVTHNFVTHNFVTHEESKIIKELHEKWAQENGYRENDAINSKNTLGFADGAKR